MDYTSQSGPTYLGNIISAADNEAIYDENVKLILADKSVLSWILRRCTNEFASESLDTIRACIDGEPAVDQLLVAPHLTNMQKRHTDRLETLSQEDTSPSEGKITFDVRFKVRVPGSDTRIEMIINVEAQKDYYPGYPLVSRGIFYASRMISAQLNKDFAAPDYGRIKSVYEYLIDTVEYNAGAPDNQCVQSALLNHQSVCAGYAKAFQYICHRMGYFCTYVTGSIRGGGDHAWNIVRIDGNYYHVDVTWGDPVFAEAWEDGTGITVMNYNYLCCTDDEILVTHVPDVDVELPDCTDSSYNYYRINNMYYETWDYDRIYNVLMDSVRSGAPCTVMKFATQEAYETAKTELFTNKLYYDADQYLMQQHGVSTWNNRYATDDEFRVITIQWL